MNRRDLLKKMLAAAAASAVPVNVLSDTPAAALPAETGPGWIHDDIDAPADPGCVVWINGQPLGAVESLVMGGGDSYLTVDTSPLGSLAAAPIWLEITAFRDSAHSAAGNALRQALETRQAVAVRVDLDGIAFSFDGHVVAWNCSGGPIKIEKDFFKILVPAKWAVSSLTEDIKL